MKKLHFIWFLMLVALVLVCTSFLIDAQADDTYNFYFQKAPGPTVVNQGVMGQTAPPSAGVASSVPAAAAAPSAPSPVATVASIPAVEPISSSGWHKWEFSIGISDDNFGLNRDYSGNINHGQFMAGLQLNLTDNFGIEGNGYYLKKAVTATIPEGHLHGQAVTVKANRFDWSAGIVLTLARVAPGSAFAGLSFSGLAGFGSAPIQGYASNASLGQSSQGSEYDYSHPNLVHKTTPYFGGRTALELGNRVALQATVKRYTKFDMTKGTLSLAYLF